MNDIAAKLNKLLRGDVSTSNADKESHSRDWSLFKVDPEMIVYPMDAQDIARLVRFVGEHKQDNPNLSITARAAGSGMSGGSLNTSIIVDVTKNMQGVTDFQKQNYGTKYTPAGFPFSIAARAKVLPGTFYRDFEKVTHAHGVEMPCYPASKNLCAVGGMVANNGAGEKSLRYGQNKNFVSALKVVLTDGKEYTIKPLTYQELQQKMTLETFEGQLYSQLWTLISRNFKEIKAAAPNTTKNAAGYLLWDVITSDTLEAFKGGEGYFDATKLIVGAQGTTGIITEIQYDLVPIEKYSKVMVTFLDDEAKLPELVGKLRQFDLETLEVYDDNTFKLAVKFAGSFIKNRGFFGAIKFAISFIPEVIMGMRGGVPKLIVLAEFVADSEDIITGEAKAAVQAIADMNLRTRITKNVTEADKWFAMRRESFKLLTDHSKGMRTAPFIDDIAIDPDHLPEYLPRLKKILDEYDLLYTIAGHVGNGNLHIIPLVHSGDDKVKNIVLELSERVYNLVKEYGGSITAEHNDGIIRTPFLNQMYSDSMLRLFAKVKDIFDPLNIFNPGKKVGGTKDDIKKYLEV